MNVNLFPKRVQAAFPTRTPEGFTRAVRWTAIAFAALLFSQFALASATFNTGDPTDCSATMATVACPQAEQISGNGADPDLNWVRLPSLNVSTSVDPKNADLDADATYSATGSISAGSIPVSWNFLIDLEDQQGGGFASWQVIMFVDVGGVQYYTGDGAESYLSGDGYIDDSGAGSIDVTTGGVITDYGVEVYVDKTVLAPNLVMPIEINAPYADGSEFSGLGFDFNTALPEPASWVDTVTCLVALVVMARRRTLAP